MVDFALARQAMVDNQIRTSAVTERRLLAALGRVPREIFVPEARRDLSYIDDMHRIGAADAGRFMVAPALFARLTQLAEIKPDDNVLDIGSGSGYSLAVLAALAATVTGLESEAGLVAQARANLKALGIGNAEVLAGAPEDLDERLFDAIMIQGAVEGQPDGLIARLAPGGRLVALMRDGGVGIARVYTRGADGVTTHSHFNANLPTLLRAKAKQEFVF
ncbi:MAG: hypothetical protein ABS75_03245 [Pelagibacterium sp. SCN 63-23]|nr:MAG: hypothetical protein ABS75_03245 [Pelagibacterium sp. SCN 63-23]